MSGPSLRISDKEFDFAIKELGEFVAISSISNVNNENYKKEYLHEAANFVGRRLEKLGFNVDSCCIEDSVPAGSPPKSSPPFVIGTQKTHNASKPTILLYGHYDIQPYDRSKWNTDPLKLVEIDGRLFARGASDDKGGIAAILAALRKLLAEGKELPVNIKILFEGEEEFESEHMPALLKQKAALLDAHVLVIMDGMNCNVNVGTLASSTRGVTGLKLNVIPLNNSDPLSEVNAEFTEDVQVLKIRVDALEQPVHSGLGCLTPDPALGLATLVNSLFAEVLEQKNLISLNMKSGVPDGGNSIQDYAISEIKLRIAKGHNLVEMKETISKYADKLSPQINGCKVTVESASESFTGKVDPRVQCTLKLASLISSLNDPSRIPGYTDDCIPLSSEERIILRNTSQTPDSYLIENKALKGTVLRGNPETSIYERLVETPSISILNIDTNSYGCEVGLRPTGGQDPNRVSKVVEDFLLSQSDNKSKIVVDRPEDGAYAWKANPLGPFSIKYQKALTSVFGKMAFLPCGGTLPLLRTFEEAFPKIEILVPGVEDPKTNAHSHNESQDKGLLRRATDSLIAFIDKAAEVRV